MECGQKISRQKCGNYGADNESSAKFCVEYGSVYHDQLVVKKNVRPFNEVKALVKYSFWRDKERHTPVPTPLFYLSGLEYEDGTTLEPGAWASFIYTCDLGLKIYLYSGKKLYVGLLYSEIINLSFAAGDDIVESGNVVGAAILGGILLGPLGAIVRGMSQAEAKTAKPSLLVIKHKSNNAEEGLIIFTIKSGHKIKIHEFIKNHQYLSKVYIPS
jgi:hypothetical protein